MLGQHRKQPVLSWRIMLVAMLLVAIFVVIGTVGSEIDFSLAKWGQLAQENVQTSALPSAAVLRAAKPDFAGGAIPESTMDVQVVPVDVLRAAKPDFAGGAVPDSTTGAQVVPVEILRLAKPDFAGGMVPDATTDGQ